MKDRELRGLHNELKNLRAAVEDRTDAVDKTFDAVSTLARSLEDLVARQSRRERIVNLNSFVAYLVFTFLLGGGFFLLYHSRAGDLVADRERAVEERDAARARARDLEDRRAARVAADKKALAYYELLREGKHSEAIAAYDGLERADLSATERAVVDDGVASARAAMIDAGYLSGVDAFRRRDYEAATAELRRGLAYADEGPRAAQMRHYLGVSLHRQGSHEEAVRQLELAIAGRVEEAGIADSRYHLATALMQAGRTEDARRAFEKFASSHPAHRLAGVSRRKAAQLARAARARSRAAARAAKGSSKKAGSKGSGASGTRSGKVP